MTGKPEIRLLLADVDGTLVDAAKRLTPEAIAAADKLRAAGIRLAITSGRPPLGMKMLFAPLQLQGPIAGFNGGMFTRPDLSIVSQRPIPKDLAHEALQLVLDQGLDAWVYDGKDWLVRKGDAPHVEHEAQTVQFDAKVVPEFTDAHLEDVIKIVGVSDDHALVERAESTAQDALGTRASATRSQPYYLDITHPDANKGSVVHALSQELGIPVDQIATIGDSPNDVLMFRQAGYSIAMGNASTAVQKQASTITRSNQENGFAHAVDMILGAA